MYKILFILALILFVICIDNDLFCMVFYPKERRVWKYLVENADKFEFDHNIDHGKVYAWEDPILKHCFLAVFLDDGNVGIHVDGMGLLLTSFHKTMAKRFKQIVEANCE